MSRTDCYFLIFLILFTILASMIIVYIKVKIDRSAEEEETEIVTSDTDPYLKMIADMRESIINQILAAIKIVWQPDEKDFIIQ